MAGLGLLAAAGVLLWLGADLFTDHASELARQWGVRPIAIGVLLAGAEPEELVTALTAVHRDRPAIAVGDVIGANMTMLTLVVGVAALLGPLRLPSVRPYVAAAAAASIVSTVFVFDGVVSRVEGVALLAGFAGLVALVFGRERVHVRVDANPSDGARGLFAFVGLGLVFAGGFLAVRGAELLADRIDLDDSAVGLTLVALATSGELFALLWASRRHGMSELALAAIVGSVAANATATLGITAVVAAPLGTGAVRTSAVLASGAAVLLLAAASTTRWPRRSGGVVLVCVYAIFVAVALR